MYKLIGINKIINNTNILNNINLELPNKGLVVISGENGSGKSTLLNILGGIDKPTKGELIFNNINLNLYEEKDLINYREQNISYILQDSNLFANLTVLENIEIVGNKNNITDVLEQLNITPLLNNLAVNLSGGEAQKVAIARALMKKSAILLADEPTSSLDTDSKQIVFNILKERSREQLVIVVTHDLSYVYSLADIILEMKNGSIVNMIKNNVNDGENYISAYKNNFKALNYSLKNLFMSKKKLIISSFLLVLSFIFVLVSISLSSLNLTLLHKDTLKMEDDYIVLFNKNEKDEDGTYYSVDNFNDIDISYLEKNKISDNNLQLGKMINVNGEQLNFKIKYDFNSKNVYYNHQIFNKLSFLDINSLTHIEYGREPKETNEIVISSYLADLMIRYGVMGEREEYIYPKDYNDLLNTSLVLNEKLVKVVGIYQVNFAKFNILNKEFKEIPKKIENLDFYVFSQIVPNIATNIYVKDNFFSLYDDVNVEVNNDINFAIRDYEIFNHSDYLSEKPRIFNDKEGVLLKDGSSLSTLNNNEIIINSEILEELQAMGENIDLSNCIGQTMTLWLKSNVNKTLDTFELIIKGVSDDEKYYLNKDNLLNYIDKKVYVNKVFIEEKNEDTLLKILNKYPLNDSTYTIRTNYSDSINSLGVVTKIFASIFKIITPIFLILSLGLLINYFYNSLVTKLKDIVILKILGVSNKQIGTIFLVEIGILLIISFVGAFILFIPIRLLVNLIIKNIIGISINILPINIISIIVVLALLIFFLSIILGFIQKKINNIYPQAIYKVN